MIYVRCTYLYILQNLFFFRKLFIATGELFDTFSFGFEYRYIKVIKLNLLYTRKAEKKVNEMLKKLR